MTTLIPKIDLMNGGSTPTGAINRTINQKLQDIISVKDFGAVGDGVTDDTTAIQNAINYVGNNGNTIFFPASTYVVAGTLNLDNASSGFTGLSFLGQSTPTGGVNGSIIKFTASSGTTIVDAKSSSGLRFEKMAFWQSNSSFTGTIFNFGHSTSGLDSNNVTFRDCSFSCTANTTPIDFTNGIISVFDNIHFAGGKYAIYANGSYFNAITITACSFNNTVNAPLYFAGSTFVNGVVIQQCTFEPLADSSGAGIYINQESDGLVYSGNWHGDANTNGIWFNCQGNANGTVISGCQFGSANTGVKITGNAQGTDVKNNVFTGIVTGIDISASSSRYGNYGPNFWYLTTNPILGTPTIGSYQSGTGQAIKYAGANIFDGSVANGVGGQISGSIWSVLSGGNVGISVQGTANLYQGINSSNSIVYQVLPSGNVQNTNNSYGAISDSKLKENIVDATPKISDLMKVKIRNFNYKTEPGNKQIGVIAQELEQVFPLMIEEIKDIKFDENNKAIDLGTTTKSVKYSVFVPILIKAIQELKSEIDTLKATK